MYETYRIRLKLATTDEEKKIINEEWDEEASRESIRAHNRGLDNKAEYYRKKSYESRGTAAYIYEGWAKEQDESLRW